MADEGTATAVTPEEHQKVVERAQKFEARMTDLEKQLERFKGFDPERARADKEALEILQREQTKGDPEKLKEWETRKEQELRSRFEGKLTEYEKANKDLSAKLTRLEVVNPAMLKAAELINSSELDMVQILVERDLMQVDGKICVRGEDGKPRASVKNPREDMGLEEYLEGIAEKHPAWAKATMQPGGKQPGNTNGTSTSGGVTAEKYARMTPAERAKIPLEERGKLANQLLKTQGTI